MKTVVGRPRSQVHLQALRAVLLIAVGSCLMTVAAHIQLPLGPVKLSMQTFAAVLIGLVYGSRLGGMTILAYIAQGSLGLPVFQSGAGIAYLAGPTGGYLVGFVAAAMLAGCLAERNALRNVATGAAAIVLSMAAIYVPGVVWLGVLFGAEKALALGLTPFIFGEVLKISLLIALVPASRSLRRLV